MAVSIEDFCTDLSKMIKGVSLEDANLIVLAAGRALVDKRHQLAPYGATMLKISTDDQKLTIVLAKDQTAPMLTTAFQALKSHLGYGD